jgi:hypothetical protein
MKADEKWEAPGNPQVIAGLEFVLERARTRNVRAAAVIYCESAGADVTFLGDESMLYQISFGATMLQRAIMDSVLNIEPMTNRAAANFVRYDLNRDPICFDFVPWLVTAEMTRRREKAPAPLHVVFAANANAITPHAHLRKHFVDGVFRPALSLFGAVEGVVGDRTRREAPDGFREMANWHRLGEPIPEMSVPPDTLLSMRDQLQGRKPVTITLREAPYSKYRNSNLDEWRKLATWLRERGDDVIVVRDSACAWEAFDGFETCPDASVDLLKRAALYETAKCNLFVQNGPSCLAFFGKVPWLLFALVSKELPEKFSQPEVWQSFMSVNDEGQLLWATDKQRIIYGLDNFETMRTAYEELGL